MCSIITVEASIDLQVARDFGFLLFIRKMFSDFMVGIARGGLRGRLFHVASAHFGMVSWQVPGSAGVSTYCAHQHLDVQVRVD
jgi:hypothetical protein